MYIAQAKPQIDTAGAEKSLPDGNQSMQEQFLNKYTVIDFKNPP
ncbi:MAG: hypothetical protein ABFD50_06855 [Smithella sp.]